MWMSRDSNIRRVIHKQGACVGVQGVSRGAHDVIIDRGVRSFPLLEDDIIGVEGCMRKGVRAFMT